MLGSTRRRQEAGFAAPSPWKPAALKKKSVIFFMIFQKIWWPQGMVWWKRLHLQWQHKPPKTSKILSMCVCVPVCVCVSVCLCVCVCVLVCVCVCVCVFPFVCDDVWARVLCVYLSLPCVSQIGRAHVWTPVTYSHLVCRLLLEKKKT